MFVHRGETITTRVSNLPFSADQIKDLYLVFRTASKVLVEKGIGDAIIDGNEIWVSLKQEDSMKLTHGPIKRSLVLLLKDGSRIEALNDSITCLPTGKKEVLT